MAAIGAAQKPAGHPRKARLQLVADSARRPATVALRRAIFAEAAALVAGDLAGAITVDAVARRLATSPRQLQRAFSDATGAGFHVYVTRMRMDRAAELLAGSDLPVKDVARRVGYREPSQFAKAFRRVHGVTPREHRMAAATGDHKA
jgi:AraC-like DNA-binding protein